MKLVTISLLALGLAVGCGNDDKKEGGDEAKTAPAGDDTKGGEAKPADKKGSADEWAEIELPDLGLVAMAPGDAKISKMGGISAMNYACQPGIHEKGDMSPSYDNQLKNVEKGNAGGKVANMVKNEKTDDDNWVIHYEIEGGKWGYFSSRKIGDKVYSCSRVSRKKEGHDCVVKVCESLKPKG
jgi:hypothetical protein